MKIILLKDVRKLGKKDDILEVSDGYANNYLIKNNLAVQYTKKSIDRLEKEIDNREIQENKLIIDMEKLKTKLEKEHIIFEVNVGDKEKMFGQISSKQIKDKLAEKEYDINKTAIEIITPIDTLGIHYVKINLHKTVSAKLQISVIKKQEK